MKYKDMLNEALEDIKIEKNRISLNVDGKPKSYIQASMKIDNASKKYLLYPKNAVDAFDLEVAHKKLLNYSKENSIHKLSNYIKNNFITKVHQ